MRFSTKYKRKSKINKIFDLGLNIRIIKPHTNAIHIMNPNSYNNLVN